jgi:hypothetical protein
MAKLSQCASELIAAKTAIAAAEGVDMTAAEVAALGALVNILAERHGDSIPLMKLLSDANRAQLTQG